MPHRAAFLTNDGVFDHKRAGTGQNHRHLQKQLPVSRGGPTATTPTRQLGSNGSSAQINQFLTYALRTLTSIGARTAHAIKFISKQTKRHKAHGERYHKRHEQNREFHDRPLSANAKPLSPTRYERFESFFASAGKAQSIGIIMPHERKNKAKRRSRVRFQTLEPNRKS